MRAVFAAAGGAVADSWLAQARSRIQLGRMRLRQATLVMLVVVACDRPAERTADASRDTAAVATAPDTTVHQDSVPIAIDHERAVDLTGDGRAERVVVRARGTRYDSLQVHTAIVDSTGRELYVHDWISLRYFQYSTPEQRSDTGDQREVERQLARLVSDAALRAVRGVDPRGRLVDVDTNAIRYHLAETALAERRDPSLAAGQPPLAETEPARVPTSLVTRTAAELKGQPSFTYFAGGEETYTIRWSPSLKRFVRVAACC
jgi:hypothetical protein